MPARLQRACTWAPPRSKPIRRRRHRNPIRRRIRLSAPQDTVDVFSSTAAAAADAIASGKTAGLNCEIDNPDSIRFVGDYYKGITARQRTIPHLGDHDSDIEVRSLDSDHDGDVFYDDYVTIQQGTSESNLLVSTEGDPPSLALIDRLARAAAWRLNHH